MLAEDVSPGIGDIERDEGRLEQVFQNLLANAVQLAPRGRPSASRARASSGGVSCTVEDQGPGLPGGDLPARLRALLHATEGGHRAGPFHRPEDRGGARRLGDRGQPPGGRGRVHGLAPARGDTRGAGSPMSGDRLLLVDDEPEVRLPIRRFFIQKQYDVQEAGSVAEAVTAFQTARPTSACSTTRCPTAMAWSCCAGSRPSTRRCPPSSSPPTAPSTSR